MKQKEAEAVLQAKIDAEVEKRTKHFAVLPPPSPAKPKTKRTKYFAVLPPPSPAKPKTKTAKTANVAPDDGVSLAFGASKVAKCWQKHAERADEVV